MDSAYGWVTIVILSMVKQAHPLYSNNEFMDTITLVLKKRRLIFLHVYHHAMVVVMYFMWFDYSQSLEVIALITNS